jgi:Fe-S cluster assembly protein SufD
MRPAKITGGGHTVIIVGKNSRLDYIEEYSGSGFMTDAVEIFADENSIINFASIQKCDKDAVVFSFKEAELKGNSTVNIVLGSFGSAFHRVRSGTMLAGEGAASETLCAFKAKGKQHTDFTVNSQHIVPHTRNNVLAKGTAEDKATSVFRGLIRIEKEAQQTDSYLADHTLLLSDTALANSIPSLQIEANDVKASHGATVGQIDEEQLFYLTSRGLTREQAEKLVVEGFFEPLTDKIADQEYKEIFRNAVIS